LVAGVVGSINESIMSENFRILQISLPTPLLVPHLYHVQKAGHFDQQPDSQVCGSQWKIFDSCSFLELELPFFLCLELAYSSSVEKERFHMGMGNLKGN
jgi:hypothetical protein